MNIDKSKLQPTPYTYLIGWSEHDLYYYGVRYANNCHPSDLWVTYFTSSKYVASYIEKYDEPDVIQIRKTFPTKIKAKLWEDKVLRRLDVASNPKFINKANNIFNRVVMDDDVRGKISEARLKQGKRFKYYNNGIEAVRVYEGEQAPEGYKKGIILTEKQKNHIQYFAHNYSRLTEEEKQIKNRTHSLKTRGVKKPPQHGANVSKALKGVPRPHMRGENNPSYTPEARRKISESWKNRKNIVWFYHPETLEPIWFYDDELEKVPENFKRGKPATGAWYNDGGKDIWVRYDSGIDTSNLIRGRIKVPFINITNGVNNKQISPTDEIPDGWRRGKVQENFKKGERKYYNNGVTDITVKIGDEIPEGFVLGKKKREKK